MLISLLPFQPNEFDAVHLAMQLLRDPNAARQGLQPVHRFIVDTFKITGSWLLWRKQGFLSRPSQVRSIWRSSGKLVGKRRCRNAGVRYSVYSVNVRFWRNLENSVVLYGQDVRNGRSNSLFANDVQIPKLDVAGSIPVSRSLFSITWEHP